MRFEWPEGATPLDPDESEGLIPSLTLKAELDEYEAINIAQAVRWASRSRAVRSELLRTQTLQDIHRRMFDRTWRWAGRLRQTQKSIGVESYRISTEVRNLCEDTKTWIEFGAYPPDEIAVRFHHRLVSIHPFANGNGCHARLATDLLCRNQGWPLFTWGSNDIGAVGAVRRRYIAALQAADRHDLAPLLDFVRT